MNHLNDWRFSLRHMLAMPEAIEALELDDEGNLVVLTANRIRVVTAEELDGSDCP